MNGKSFHFSRFDAVDHRLSDVELRWTYQPARPLASISDLARLSFWKAS